MHFLCFLLPTIFINTRGDKEQNHRIDNLKVVVFNKEKMNNVVSPWESMLWFMSKEIKKTKSHGITFSFTICESQLLSEPQWSDSDIRQEWLWNPLLPKRQSEPDSSQFHRVLLHWVVEAFHESRPDLWNRELFFLHLLSGVLCAYLDKGKNKKKCVILLWAQPWFCRGPWAQGWLTHSASPPAHPTAWGL